jgi:AraC family transcriptional regulator
MRYEVGENSCRARAGTPIHENQLAHATLGFVLSGSFDYRAQSGSVTAVPGSLLFGNEGELFSCYHIDDQSIRRLVVAFDEAFLEEIADSVGLRQARFNQVSSPPGRFSAATFARMRRLSLASVADDETAYELAASALLTHDEVRTRLRVSSRNRMRMLQVLQHIETYYPMPCRLVSLAELARMSPYHFLRVFKKVVGVSPTQYVINVRLRAATELLVKTRMPITEVSHSVGFKDISHFNASFKTLIGCSPGAWRCNSHHPVPGLAS